MIPDRAVWARKRPLLHWVYSAPALCVLSLACDETDIDRVPDAPFDGSIIGERLDSGVVDAMPHTLSDAGGATDSGSNEVGSVDSGGADAGLRDAAPADTSADAAAPMPDAGPSYQAGPACGRVDAADDRDRLVVFSLPFAPNADPDDRYHVFRLTSAGSLVDAGHEFRMRRARPGKAIDFTRDGRIGVVAQDDGTLGVFRILEDGTPEVVDGAFTGPFYAESVVMDPSSDRVWVLDTQWIENGGGIYGVHLGCSDGTPTFEGKLVDGRLIYGLEFLPNGDAAAGAISIGASLAGDDAHVVSLGSTVSPLLGADAFGHDDAIIGGFAVTAGGQHMLLSDTSIVATQLLTPVVEIGTNGLVVRQMLSTGGIETFIVSPFDDVILGVVGGEDGLLRFDYVPTAIEPLTFAGTLPATGSQVLLPGHGEVIQRGPLRGLAVIAELVGLRRVRFQGGGVVNDLGATQLTTDPNRVDLIVGALGVTP